jgi:aspartyl-tRNA(Asn)/glutamyl-tRNA(Gln) amidotransferase subunit C
MVQITLDTVRYIATLSRIACTPTEEASLLHDMKGILEYIALLDEVSCDGIQPCNNVSECLRQTPLRNDVVGPTIPRDDFLKITPQHIGGMVRVPPVLKGGE